MVLSEIAAGDNWIGTSMSMAIHFFTMERFSEESYRKFLGELLCLYGKWKLIETGPFHDDPASEALHDCWIQSDDLPDDEWFRVNVIASNYIQGMSHWGFAYERALDFETGAGRSFWGVANSDGEISVSRRDRSRYGSKK